jgi:hypothetical protein
MNKHAVIDTHDNKTLSKMVQELSFKAGFVWWAGGEQLTDSLRYLVAGQCGHWGSKGTLTHTPSLNNKPKEMPILDAATQMDKVIAFFEAPAKPESISVKLDGHHPAIVKADGSILWHCGTTLSSANVDALIKARAAFLKEVA